MTALGSLALGLTLLCAVRFMSAPAQAEPVMIGALIIDRTEVTVSRFAAFADRTGLVTQAEATGGGFEWRAGWQRRSGWTYRTPYGAPAAPDAPAVHVTWSEAEAFCRDAGGRLPTRAEWTAAAYTESRPKPTDGYVKGVTYPYPVGRAPDGMNVDGARHMSVGTTKRGINGLYDMGANVWEWLADRDAAAALTAGGSWWYGPAQTRVDGMQWKPFDFYAVYVGFRCVYD